MDETKKQIADAVQAAKDQLTARYETEIKGLKALWEEEKRKSNLQSAGLGAAAGSIVTIAVAVVIIKAIK